ncbi:MAG: hypothetical protein FJ087_02895 [Deltaproteobacteria bacterium]|nr:hypothetical protein [Deltaproteobacteria bacterium]
MGTARSLADVAREFGLRLVVRFGSTATHRAGPSSDQDIAVLASSAPDLDRETALVVALGEALGGPDVDLTVLNRADPLLLFEVVRQGVPLFEAEPALFAATRSYASRRYDDTLKFRLALSRWLEARLG